MAAPLQSVGPEIADLHGRFVQICSPSGIVYGGIVVRIMRMGFGEWFELGSRVDPAYERMVYVRGRAAQIRLVSEPDPRCQ